LFLTNLRLAFAVGLGVAALVLLLTVIAIGGALQAGLAPWPGIGAILLATAAFVVSWKQRSFLVAGLLSASGVVSLTYGLIVTEFFAVIVFPGPVFGVIIGFPILGLGMAKGIETALTGRSKTATTAR
jgi:hypothetical protein